MQTKRAGHKVSMNLVARPFYVVKKRCETVRGQTPELFDPRIFLNDVHLIVFFTYEVGVACECSVILKHGNVVFHHFVTLKGNVIT